jgi:hypothetical protein
MAQAIVVRNALGHVHARSGLTTRKQADADEGEREAE